METNNNAVPVIYFNDISASGDWMLLDLEGTTSNRDAVGAVVRLGVGDRTITRQVTAGSGYASQRMHALHFGLGSAPTLTSMEIRWPSGSVERFDAEALDGFVNQRLMVVEGEGSIRPQTTAAPAAVVAEQGGETATTSG